MTRHPDRADAAGVSGGRHRIVVRGRLGEALSNAFDGLRLEVEDGTTIREGALVDQAQLYGLLDRLRDLALELVRVEEVES
jgi:ABC-type phosphonate transport system ATPase subunit